MKKFFTLFSGLLLATGLTATAQQTQTITCEVQNSSFVKIGDTPETTLSYQDGVFTIESFFGSGQPLSFTLSSFTVDEEGDLVAYMDFVGDNVSYDADYSAYWIMKANDPEDNITASYTDTDDNPVKVKTPMVYNGSASFVYKYDGYDGYNVYICGTGQNAITGKWPYYEIYFHFDEFEGMDTEPVGEAVNVYIMDVSANILDDGITAEKEVADAFKATISKDESGNYILSNFLDSEKSISFTFEKPTVNNSSSITLVGEVPTDGWLYNYKNDDDWSSVSDISVFADQGYSYVAGLSPAKYEYDYLSVICVKLGKIDQYNATTEEYDKTTENEWVNLAFYFNEPKSDDTTAVEKVEVEEVDENAPVIFYNLNGQRVENPANGIFIRKQGSKTSKVVVR